jgi:flagellar hook-length control protein FliK
MDAKVANSAKFLDAISALSANFSTTAGGGARSGDDAGFAKLMDQMQARARQAQDARQAAENNRPRERAAAPKVAGLLSAQAPARRDDAPAAPERAEAPAAAQPKDDAAPTRQTADKPAAPPAKTSAKASAKDAARAADAVAKDQAAQDVAENQSAEADAAATEVAETADSGAAETKAEPAETVVAGESETADTDEAVVAAPVVVVTTEAAPVETGAEIAAAVAAAPVAPQTAGESTTDETSVAPPVVEDASASVPAAAPSLPGEEIPVAPTAPTLTDEAAPAVVAAPVVAAGGQVAETAPETAAVAAPVIEAPAFVTDSGESVDIAAPTEQTPTTEEAAAAPTTQTADKPAEKTEAKPTVVAPTAAPAPTPVTAAAPQVSADDGTSPQAAPVEAPVAAAADETVRAEETAAGKTAAAEGEAKPHVAKKADGEQVKTNPATAPTPAENADPRRGGEQNNERRNGGEENRRLGGGLGLAAINELAPATETAGGPAKFDSFLGMSADGVKQTTAPVGEAGAASGLRATRGGHAHLQQSGATDQVAVQIKKAAKDGIERISMQLRPEELGRVDVRMEIGQDGKITAQIAVERAQTLELLQKDQKALEKALQEAGFNADSSSLSFSLKEQGGDAYREQAEQNGGGRRRRAVGGQDEEDAAANVVAYTVNLAAGRVDVCV